MSHEDSPILLAGVRIVSVGTVMSGLEPGNAGHGLVIHPVVRQAWR